MIRNLGLHGVVHALLLTGLFCTMTPSHADGFKKAPPTRQDNVKETLHGVEIVDRFRWLENQESSETRAWVKTQMDYTRANLASRPGREIIQKRLSELMRVDVAGIPQEKNGYYFLMKRAAEQDQSVLYRRKGLRGKDEVLIDPTQIDPTKKTSLSVLDIDDKAKLLAYGLRKGGEDEIEVRFRDLSTGQDIADKLPRGRYGVTLLPDGSGLYYSLYKQDVGTRIYYHKIGSPISEDKLVFGEGYGADKGIGVGLSEDGKWLMCTVFYGSAASKTEVYVKNLAKGGDFVTIVNDIDSRFSGEIVDDWLYMVTNWKAPNERVLRVDLNNPARDNWKEIIPTRQDAVLDGISMVGGKLYANYLENVTSKLKRFDVDGKFEDDVTLPTLGTARGPYGRWKGKEAFYNFSSFALPSTNYRINLTNHKQQVFSRVKVPVNPDRFEVKQVFFSSKDGTRVPMFLVHLKGLKLDGKRPTLLYGYGGFNLSSTPGFSSVAAFIAEQGGVYAVANLRGGGEYGEDWHRAGMLEKKQNVFDDFYAAAEWLQKNDYTNPSKLAIYGGSNGGLLVGAAMTQRPELFGAVLCGVPLLDMLRYHKFLLARYWVPEYGSSEDPKQFEFLRAYSPYHNVREGVKYPPVMFITGDADTRVAPLHARKMAALIQTLSPETPVLLHYDLESGHSSGKPLSIVVNDETDKLLFMFWQLGVPGF